MRLRALTLLGALLLATTVAGAAVDARMLRYPDVSADRIAFVYAGDVWLVPKAGGIAARLSTPLGEESFPRFSPDGRRLAFSGNYDGNTDLYVVETDGGMARRLTHHPDTDRMLDWYPDGESILYSTSMASGTNRFSQLWRVDDEGGLPEKLPVPYGEFGTLSSDGRRLAYTPLDRSFRTWKRYRGGMAPDVWLFDLETHDWRRLTEHVANDSLPMWHGSKVYFLSDRGAGKRYNLWSVDASGGEPRQLTFFENVDVAFPSMGPQEIVFSAGSDLYLLPLSGGEPRKVRVEVVTDRATLRPRVESVGQAWQSADVSPSGKRVVLEARGELFSLPAEHGVIRNLTHSSGSAERYPAWSPDGKTIAYFSDASGEYELTVRPADGSGEPRKLTEMGPGFRYNLFWSPDSKTLAFIDEDQKIQLYHLPTDDLRVIDSGLYLTHGGLSAFRVSWSPDSRWLAWSRGLESRVSAIFLHDTKEKETHQVTAGFYDDFQPAFDPDGKYLYFLSRRTHEPTYSNIDNSWIYTNTTNVVAVPLRRDVPSPLAPRNDVEKPNGEDDDDDDENGEDDDGEDDDDNGNGKKGAKKDDKKKGDDDEDAKGDDKPVEPVKIDLEGFEARLVVLPPKAGAFDDLFAVPGKIVFRRPPRSGSDAEETPLVWYDLEEREEKTILADVDGWIPTSDGNKALVAQDRALGIIELKPDQKLEDKLDLAAVETQVDPVAEWRQIFDDAWRFERDYFYDPNMHGVDWEAMREQYGALLDDAVTRWDVNFVLGELIGELNASHAYRGGGDTEQAAERGVGLLGVDWALENGAYRIQRIIRGAPWDHEARSPLAEAGVDVEEGDYVLAVNGVPIDTSLDPWAAFGGLADRTIALTVNDRPTLEGAREVVVKTLSDEGRLRNLAWIEENRKRVEEATDGRVGYVYVPDTSIGGQTELVRMFAGQSDSEALIVDERFNSGGQIPDRFVELLDRPIRNYWAVRSGRDWQWPPITVDGPKVMLINGWSGSGGDLFPFYFKQSGLGPLIGTRTWGGLIGISGSPPLVDGGGVTVPTFSIYDTEGNWIVEGHGVEPDIEVWDDPSQLADGTDPQLERAIEEALRRLEQNPPTRPKRPAYTDRSR